MRIDVVTLFPEFFHQALETGLLGRAQADGRFGLGYVNPRDFTTDRHRSVDDTPYGGGAGMVMKPEPLASAIESVRRSDSRIVLMSPQGAPLTQARLESWSKAPHLVLVAGRYEGFDERVRALVDEEASIGDYVLTGGEYAALVIVDGVVRLLPGTLGNSASSEADSFSAGLLEHPQFTRPQTFLGDSVPQVLTSGDHARISRWRREQALLRTRLRRPDLLEGITLSPEDRIFLRDNPLSVPRPHLAVAVSPTPERLADLAGLAVSFGITRVRILPEPGVSPEALCTALEETPARSWPIPLPPPKRRRDVPRPLTVTPREVLEVVATWEELFAADPAAWVVHTARPTGRLEALSPSALRKARSDAVPWGIAIVAEDEVDQGSGASRVFGELPTIRAGASNWAMDPVSLAAVALDRVLGEG